MTKDEYINLQVNKSWVIRNNEKTYWSRADTKTNEGDFFKIVGKVEGDNFTIKKPVNDKDMEWAISRNGWELYELPREVEKKPRINLLDIE